MRINEVVNYSLFFEMDPSRRGFLKKLGKGAMVLGAAALINMLPKEVQAAMSRRDCQRLWELSHDAMEMAQAGADKKRIESQLVRRYIKGLETGSKYDGYHERLANRVIDIAIEHKDDISAYDYAELFYNKCLKGDL